MTPRPITSKHNAKPALKPASISKHAKILGSLGGRPKENFMAKGTWTKSKDDAADKKAGIKENSKRDKSLDKKRKVK